MLLSLLLLACTPTVPTAVVPSSAPQPFHLTDSDGRTLIHRGVNLNSAAKRRPDYAHGLSEAELDLLPAHGITLVRYLVFWEAIEPEDGQFDEAYLARVHAEVSALSDRGLKIVLDLHQDVYGEGFGSTGLPAWTCDSAYYDAFTWNDSNWFLNYADPSVIACFDGFWASPELQDRYALAAAHLVEETRDIPGVTGLDVMNEPFWGSLTSLEHDTVALPAFYARVLSRVREVHPTLRLWLAPSVTSNLDGQTALDLSGIDDPYIGLAPHFYPPYAELGTGWNGDFSTESATLGRLLDHAEEQGVPFMLGEFGIFSALGGEDDYIREVLGAVHARGGSAVWWSFDRGSGVLTEDGSAGALLPVFAEPWVHKIPGTLESIGERVELTLHGEGSLEWVAPGAGPCTAEVDGGELLGLEQSSDRVEVRVSGSGRLSVRLRCEAP